MSHFTKVRTRLTDGAMLRRALEELGHEVRPATRGVRGFLRRRTPAEFKIRPDRGGYEIGFANAGDGYEVIADWWGIHGTDQEKFVRELTQTYALVSTVSTLHERGFQVQRQENEESGDVRVVLRRVRV